MQNNNTELYLAPFRFDVTPPMGHSLCGGWIKPVEAVDDPLEAIGFVLTGAGQPIVICAVDWTGILNEAHLEWRSALASAAGTTPDRVAVHTVHPHNAPFACLEAQRIVSAHPELPHIIDLDFHRRCLDRGQRAIATALKGRPRRVTHIAHGQAKVEKVASNRRIYRDAAGRVITNRNSSCATPELRDLPEGLIDPWLKTIAFFDGDTKVAACHYYATHPMSYYGDGRVSADFAGLARRRRQDDEPDCQHVYFNGCGGNIAAGKYNDGSKPMRVVLMQRLYEGIVASERDLKPAPLRQISWQTTEILPSPRPDLSAPELQAKVDNPKNPVVDRNRPALMLSWVRRAQRGVPLLLSALRMNDISILHLPAECFIEYQLRAQEQAPGRFVAVAAYGDDGPWYIPVKEEYDRGGYESSVAFAAPEIDDLLMGGIRQLLGAASA